MTRPKRVRAPNGNSFATLSTDGEGPTQPSPTQEVALEQPELDTTDGPVMLMEEEELSDLKPLTLTPTAQGNSLTQSSLLSFVQTRLRAPDLSRPIAPKQNSKPNPQAERPAGRPQPPPSQRLQHIDAALKFTLQEESTKQQSFHGRVKRRRTEEDDGEHECLSTATVGPIHPYSWEPSQHLPLRYEHDGDEEEDDSMYVTEDSGDDRPSKPNHNFLRPPEWTPVLEPMLPTKPRPRKRFLHPAVPKQPLEGRVNPFARFAPTTQIEGATLPSVSPYVVTPQEGFPPLNMTPVETFKFCMAASIERMKKIEGNTLASYIASNGRITAPIDLARRKVLMTMSVKAIVKDPNADHHITPMEVNVNKPEGGTYQHKVIQPWIISNLSSAALTTLESNRFWSQKEITIGILGRPSSIPIPLYCLTLWETTFLDADKAAGTKMSTQVRTVLKGNKDFCVFIKTFDDLWPMHMGPDQFLQFIIDMAQARPLLIEHNRSPMVIFLVDIESPTSDAEEWDKVRQGLRHMDWTGVHCATVKPRIHDFHCGFCKGLDHPTPQCPLPHLRIHSNTIDADQNDGPHSLQSRRGAANDDEKVNPFGGPTIQNTKSAKQSRQAETSRFSNSRDSAHIDTPRPPPFLHNAYAPFAPYQPFPHPPARRNTDRDGGANQSCTSTTQGRGRSGCQDNASQHQDWQTPQWPPYPQHHPQYLMQPPVQPPHHPQYYGSDQQYY